MGDANLVERISGCLLGFGTLAVGAALTFGLVQGFRYVSARASLEFRRGDMAIVQTLDYSPYTNERNDYKTFLQPITCRVDDFHINLINPERPVKNYRLECPGQDGTTFYGWLDQGRMSKP